MKRGIPEDIRAINETIRAFLDTKDRTTGIPIRRALGVYAFYDYDNEPIYVGQTEEGLVVSHWAAHDESAHRRSRHECPRPI